LSSSLALAPLNDAPWQGFHPQPGGGDSCTRAISSLGASNCVQRLESWGTLARGLLGGLLLGGQGQRTS